MSSLHPAPAVSVPPALRFSGAVLTGGRSTRMGQDKAGLVLPDGESLLSRAVRVVRTVGAVEVLISVRPGQSYMLPATREIVDGTIDAGPLAGLAAVLESANESLVLVLAVDLAAISPECLGRLLSRATPQCGALFEDEAGLQPLVAVYPKLAAVHAQRALVARRLSLRAFAIELEAAGLMQRVRLDSSFAAELRNFNTPEEWQAVFRQPRTPASGRTT